jgi:hypothetical protein
MSRDTGTRGDRDDPAWPAAAEPSRVPTSQTIGLVLIAAWLLFQVGFPLVRKFEIPSMRLRSLPFSWAMFAGHGFNCDVALYAVGPNGEPLEIPDLSRYVHKHESPGPTRLRVKFASRERITDRYSRLVTQIAHDHADGRTYVASILWIDDRGAEELEPWEFRIDAE